MRDDGDDHSQKNDRNISGYCNISNISSLHPSLNLHPFTSFFLLKIFSGSFGLVLLALLAGVLEFTLWSEDFSTKEPGNFGDPLKLGQYTEACYTFRDVGTACGRNTVLPRCQSGKVVKFDSQMMSGDIAHHRKWCWTGKLF